ncbi:hypothetical protein ACFOON_03950 [Novosphingobium piscinae]|uniref:Uncharacterized protein n=1 Tax=Novosphingobium piscinae TaxID=1507448 RepID=A0A7X1G1J1_9SPHN|nr:hypothetical protein [Novosphingobium piscinae]MBC2670237.1 hypothetical protein [Novosphingobium piscinae]
MWFAALFGMGSMALRAEVLEAGVHWLQLDLVVPAAAPPLGFTARLLVAVLFAGLGALTGFILARLVARRPARGRPLARSAQRAAPKAAPRTAPLPFGLDALAEDNDDLARLDAAREAQPARRRGFGPGLAANEASDPFAAPMPLVIPTPAILNLGELEAVDPLIAPLEPAAAVLSDTPAADAPAAPPAVDAQTAITLPQTVPPAAPDPGPATAGQANAPEVPSRRLVPRAGTAAQVLRAAPLEALGVVELVERFALALADRRDREVAAMPESPAPAAAPDTMAEGAMLAAAAAMPATEPPPATVAPFADPHPVELPRGRPFDMPAMLRPGRPGGQIEWFDSAEEPDQVPAPASPLAPRGLSLAATAPASTPAEPVAQPEGAVDRGGRAAEREDRFASLLDIKPSSRPAEGLAAAAPAGSPAEVTEDALRHALAALQRMSGAA